MSDDQLLERQTTAGIIGAFFEVYNRLGFGFLEHVYSLALERELIERGHVVSREVIVTVSYKGKSLTPAHGVIRPIRVIRVQVLTSSCPLNPGQSTSQVCEM